MLFLACCQLHVLSFDWYGLSVLLVMGQSFYFGSCLTTQFKLLQHHGDSGVKILSVYTLAVKSSAAGKWYNGGMLR